MELNLKLLLLVLFVLLVVVSSPSDGSDGWRRPRGWNRPPIATRPPVSVNSTSRPPLFMSTPSTPSTPSTRPPVSANSTSRPPLTKSTPSTRPPVWLPSTTPPKPSVPTIPQNRCFRVVDKLPRYVKGFSKIRPLCLRLNESQLLQRLKDVGGYNPRYVAINRDSACKFTDLSQDLQAPPRNSSARQKRMVSVSQGSNIRGCWGRGSLIDGSSLRHMCTECSSTTQLAANIFPRFINELICGDDDGFCYRRYGRCLQKVIKFNFLRRTGQFALDVDLSSQLGINVFVEITQVFQQDIRSCCACGLFPFIG